jgi:hypothetical protein
MEEISRTSLISLIAERLFRFGSTSVNTVRRDGQPAMAAHLFPRGTNPPKPLPHDPR